MDSVLAIVAVLISIVSCLFAAGTFFWTVHRDRRQATLDAFNTLQNEVFDHMNQIKPSDIKHCVSDTTSSLYKEMSSYIARLEHFCVGVNTKIYDRDIVYQLAHGYLDSNTIRSRIDPIINRKNSKAEIDYYENIHKVLKWLENKDKK